MATQIEKTLTCISGSLQRLIELEKFRISAETGYKLEFRGKELIVTPPKKVNNDLCKKIEETIVNKKELFHEVHYSLLYRSLIGDLPDAEKFVAWKDRYGNEEVAQYKIDKGFNPPLQVIKEDDIIGWM